MTTVQARRRIVFRAGMLAMALATAAAATACIFDDGGDYKGGGRIDRAATAGQQASEPDTGGTPTSTGTGTSTGTPDTGTLIPDTGGGG
jgi:hypothetical protein